MILLDCSTPLDKPKFKCKLDAFLKNVLYHTCWVSLFCHYFNVYAVCASFLAGSWVNSLHKEIIHLTHLSLTVISILLSGLSSCSKFSLLSSLTIISQQKIQKCEAFHCKQNGGNPDLVNNMSDQQFASFSLWSLQSFLVAHWRHLE